MASLFSTIIKNQWSAIDADDNIAAPNDPKQKVLISVFYTNIDSKICFANSALLTIAGLTNK